jgi:asparagine synthase (glutamine-hydrolysing)
LETAVRRHLISDVPVGIFLSGGVDSGTVTAVASSLSDRPLQTFSIGFANTDFDESADARVIAERCGTLHHIFRVESHQFDEEVFYRLVRQFDEPFADSSAIPTYFLCQMASEFVKVALSATVAMNCSPATIYYYLRTLFAFRQSPELLKSFGSVFSSIEWPFQVARQFKKGTELLDMSLEEMILAVNFYFNETEKQNDLCTGDWGAASDGYQTFAILDPFRQAMQKMNAFEKAAFLDFKLGLPDDMLTKVDRMSMLHSLEVRVPLLDFDLIEFAGEVPFSLKLKNGTGKYLLKRTAAAHFPKPLVRKRKQGFEIPLHSWINAAFRNVIEEALSEACVRKRGYFKPEYVRKLVNDFLGHSRHFPHLSRYQINFRLWMLLVLEYWLRIYAEQ